MPEAELRSKEQREPTADARSDRVAPPDYSAGMLSDALLSRRPREPARDGVPRLEPPPAPAAELVDASEEPAPAIAPPKPGRA